jgi:hypothetical protein
MDMLKKLKSWIKMIAGVVTYGIRITSVFVSRKLNVVGNVETALSKVGEVKNGNLGRERE